MNGFRVAGKCFCACEDLRRTAQKYKGWTVAQLLRLKRIEEAERVQFGEGQAYAEKGK